MSRPRLTPLDAVPTLDLLRPVPPALLAPPEPEVADRPALVEGELAITYAELDDRVRSVAARLGRGRRVVAVACEKRTDAVVAYLAALRGGHVALLLPDEDHPLVAAYRPDVVLGPGNGWAPGAAEARRAPGHDLHPDLALLMTTSGSTGSAKVVRLSRTNVASNAAAIAGYLRLTADDRAMATLPMQHCYGLSVLNSHLWAGASVVLDDRSVVDPCFWTRFREAGATSFAGVPHTFELLERVGFESMSLPSLRFITQAGGKLRPELVRRYAELGARDGWELYVMYGQTEATARMAYLPPHLAASHPAAIGVAIPGGELSLEPVDETPAGDDEPGPQELVYRGPNVMLGYAHSPADLALGRTVHELRTGDLGRRTAEGLFEVTGRRSRFVKPYGIRVDLDDLERWLRDAGVATTCTGDDTRVVVAVEAAELERTATTAPDVAALVSGRLGVAPGRVSVLELAQIPLLPSGKPDHVALRDLAAAAAPGPEASSSSSESMAEAGDLAGAVAGLYAAVLGRAVEPDETFVSAGGDSLSFVELSIGLERLLGTLPADWHVRPIGELVAGAGPAPRRRALREVETSAVARAVAIALVVGTHTDVWHVPGGAHALLAVAGFNLARFSRSPQGLLRAAARIAVPSMCWIGLVAAVSDQWSWQHAVLLRGWIGEPGMRWGYWFVEAIVQILVVAAAVLAVPPVRRLERRAPYAFALGVAALGLAVRFDLLGLPSLDRAAHRPHEVLWLLGVGWAGALARTTPRRLLASAPLVLAVPGMFDDLAHGAVVAAGALAVIWLPTVRVPAPATRLLGPVAAASLWTYLTHWQVFPPVERALGAPAATAASLAVGVAASIAARRLAPVAAGAVAAIRSAAARPRRRFRTALAG